MLRIVLKETKPDKNSAVQELILHCKIYALNTILSLPLKKWCHGNLDNKNHAIKKT
jgi:hypothetical protein